MDYGSSCTSLFNIQVARALAQSDIILFIVDAREGITPIDEMFARQLRVLMEEQPARGGQAQCHIEHHQREPSVSPSRSPSVILVLNKAEGVKGAECIGDAYELQLGHPVAVSTRTKQVRRCKAFPSKTIVTLSDRCVTQQGNERTYINKTNWVAGKRH